MKKFEVEFRARFSKSAYDALGRLLRGHATDLGANDQSIWFFIMPDKLLKVTHNITQKTAKITLKLTKIGKGSHFEEIEFPIATSTVAEAVKMFRSLGLPCFYEPKILRHNFLYQKVEIALKYSKTWGYHAEFEVLVDSLRKKAAAEQRIRKVADSLGVRLMSDKELWDFTQSIEKTMRRPHGK